jgi:RNA polymerase sigma factor (sigma-70 family)
MPGTRLEALFGAGLSFHRWDPRPDEELLARFLDQRDASAFEVLLVRHAPAVHAACRGWLRSAADIEDAAQATFLVLVQRARAIRDRRAVGRWLYGVAANVARRLGQQQKQAVPLPAELPARPTTDDAALRDLLAEEVARLPEKYRLPVQLCYWAGLTTAEAARRLGVPKGTVLTRLAWARKRLHKGLTQRGVSLAAGLTLAGAASTVHAAWLHATVRAASCLLAGQTLADAGISERTISLTEGVVRAMIHDKFKRLVLALLLIAGLAGFGIYQWGLAADGRDKEAKLRTEVAPGQEPARGDDTHPGPLGRRRAVVIRLPAGTFTKDVEAPPYGSGRSTWTYEDDRLLGHLEGTVLGVEFDVSVEAEYSLSSTGTIYGLITAFRVNHVRLPDDQKFADFKPFLDAWSALEPLVNDLMLDLPFSYQFRVQGDRLVISNFRMLLAGPNPLGKLGGIVANGPNELFAALSYFQVLSTALEGTFTASDGKAAPPPRKRPGLQKPAGRGEHGPAR